MNWFKDLVREDIESVFLDSEVFAEPHDIDGKKVLCVIDKNLNQSNENESFLGVFINLIRIHIKKGEIPTPREGAMLRVDGSRHLVRTVSDEEGMLVITAEANVQQ